MQDTNGAYKLLPLSHEGTGIYCVFCHYKATMPANTCKQPYISQGIIIVGVEMVTQAGYSYIQLQVKVPGYLKFLFVLRFEYTGRFIKTLLL